MFSSLDSSGLKFSLAALSASALLAAHVSAATVVDDSWADAGRDNGADANDTDWYHSTNTSGIEVGANFLGLVSGNSGRGIHGTFAAQSMNVGDVLTATFTFDTPATVGNNQSTDLRVGLFDTSGSTGVGMDIVASSGSPDSSYNNIFGYMADFDVNTGSANITVRERSAPGSGQLMATTGDFDSLGSGGDLYSFAANTSYTGVLSLTRTGADTVDITVSLFQGTTLLSTTTESDDSGIVSSFDMLAFHVGSNGFGSVNTADTPDNGIDFTNILIEYDAVPEPGSLALLGLGGLALMARRRKD